MTRLDVAFPDRLRHRGRRGGALDFRCDCGDGRLMLSDTALAEAVVTGEAELVRVGPGPDGRTDAAARPAREEEARRRLAYVQDAPTAPRARLATRTSGVWSRPPLAASATPTRLARRRCAGGWPGWATTRARRGCSRTTPARAAACRTSEVAEAIKAEINRCYLRRPPISLVALHGFVHVAVDRLNAGCAAKLDVPGYHAVLARPPREVHEARHGRTSADRAFALVRAAPKAPAPLDEVKRSTTPSPACSWSAPALPC